MIRMTRVGRTRIVFLVHKWAVKTSNVLEWRLFLHGLLANMQGMTRSRGRFSRLCPVLFSLPGGFLVIMPRVREMTDEEFADFDYESFVEHPDCRFPAENKSNSFGWLKGSAVVIDYG